MRIDISNAQINVEVKGRGQPVLLVHGFPFDHRMWSHQFAELGQRVQVIAPDLRGYGTSSALREPTSIARFAEELMEVLDRLPVESPADLCGLSMGGYIALQLVHRWPDRFRRLVLCHTRSAADSVETARGRRLAIEQIRRRGPADFLAAMAEKLIAPSTASNSPEKRAEMMQWLAEASPESLVHTLDALATRPDATPWLGSLPLPVLVVAGNEDGITPAAEMREMAEKIPQARFIALPDCGHLSPLERPGEFNAQVLQFLTSD